jgi:hypothetical protein
MNKLVWMALAGTLAIGCSKKKEGGAGGAGGGGGACKPLAVTVDGQPLAAMPNGLARSNNMNGDITYEVQMFNHDKSTCEEMVSKGGRQVPEGEVSVRAFAGGAGMMGRGVGIESHTQAAVDATLISDKPKGNGDVVKICVKDASFTPKIGDYKDKKVTITGLFEGKYCGELKW